MRFQIAHTPVFAVGGPLWVGAIPLRIPLEGIEAALSAKANSLAPTQLGKCVRRDHKIAHPARSPSLLICGIPPGDGDKPLVFQTLDVDQSYTWVYLERVP